MRAKDNILFSSEAPIQEKQASITGAQVALRRNPERLFPYLPDSSELTLRCHRSDFSASRIARAVEDCDAHLVNLNVTSVTPDDPDDLLVDIRINHRNSFAVARSLERYGFEVAELPMIDPEVTEAARERISQLLINLDI